MQMSCEHCSPACPFPNQLHKTTGPFPINRQPPGGVGCQVDTVCEIGLRDFASTILSGHRQLRNDTWKPRGNVLVAVDDAVGKRGAGLRCLLII